MLLELRSKCGVSVSRFVDLKCFVSNCKQNTRTYSDTVYRKGATLNLASPTKSGAARLSRPAELSVPDVSCQKGRNSVLHFHTQQPPTPVAAPTFQKGDSVVLVTGTYEGTIGTFLNLKDDDPKWADILEQNSLVRSHPVEWLHHSSRN